MITEYETNIAEYAEEEPVKIIKREVNYCCETYLARNGTERIVIQALNEGGYNRTLVDLIDVLSWVKKNMPELLETGDTNEK